MKHCQIIYGRVTVFDGVIQELNVFVWELEPLDDQTRSVREWVEEYIREDVGLLSTIGIKDTGGWEAVFSATIHAGSWYPDEGADIVLRDWQSQQLPSEMFE